MEKTRKRNFIQRIIDKSNDIAKLLKSVQMLTVGIMLNFLILGTLFSDFLYFDIEYMALLFILFVMPLIIGLGWLLQALRGKSRVQYFKHHKLWYSVEWVTGFIWIVTWVLSPLLEGYENETWPKIVSLSCYAVGVASYMLISSFAERTDEVPESVEKEYQEWNTPPRGE